MNPCVSVPPTEFVEVIFLVEHDISQSRLLSRFSASEICFMFRFGVGVALTPVEF